MTQSNKVRHDSFKSSRTSIISQNMKTRKYAQGRHSKGIETHRDLEKRRAFSLSKLFKVTQEEGSQLSSLQRLVKLDWCSMTQITKIPAEAVKHRQSQRVKSTTSLKNVFCKLPKRFHQSDHDQLSRCKAYICTVNVDMNQTCDIYVVCRYHGMERYFMSTYNICRWDSTYVYISTLPFPTVLYCTQRNTPGTFWYVAWWRLIVTCTNAV